MRFVLQLLRIGFIYLLLYFACLIAVLTWLPAWPAGAQIVVIFGLPGLIVWWMEHRRSSKAKAGRSGSGNGEPSPSATPRPSRSGITPPPLPSAKGNAETPPPFPGRWQKLDNKAIVERARRAGPELAAIAAKKQEEKLTGPQEPTDTVSRPDPLQGDRENAQEEATKAGPARRSWQKLNNKEIVESARRVRPKLAKIQEKRQAERASGERARGNHGWIPADQSVSVGGRDLGGMIYVGIPPSTNEHGYREKCRAYIDPSLPVARNGNDKDGSGMPYWPGYSSISTTSRATYLDWLAGGRDDPSYNVGYMFLYFYGIERRFFVDNPPDAEKAELLLEVRRLSVLYQDNHSARRYLGQFIQFAEVATADLANISPVFESTDWEMPASIKFALGVFVEAGHAISADWLLSWLCCHPDYSRRMPAKRCPEEFRALFRLRFGAKFPDGLKVNKPKKTLTFRYQAASNEFDGTLTPDISGKPLPDVSGLRKPIRIAQEIADAVTDELDKYSRFLGRNAQARGSVEAHALLPFDLWPLFRSDEIEGLKSWASAIVREDGIISSAEVVERLEGQRPEKIGKRRLTDASDALARLGIGLAPDPRFGLRSPKPSEPVVLFDLGEPVETLETVSETYRASLIELALGSFVAHADGHIADPERQSLLDHIASTDGLSDVEKRRLRANLDWFLAIPPDLSLLRRKLKDLDPEQHVDVRAALVSAAHADGTVSSDEVAGIEKIYKSLGLDPALAYSDLHAGEVEDGPRTVRTAQPTVPGEAIPQTKSPATPRLDVARIAAIRSDTERVSSVLGDIFSEADDSGDLDDESAPVALSGLDRKHTALVHDLIQREHWTEEAFHQLCSQHKLLAAGALEAVNEWAFDAYEEALLDEYDGYELAVDVAALLKTDIEKGGRHVQIEAT